MKKTKMMAALLAGSLLFSLISCTNSSVDVSGSDNKTKPTEPKEDNVALSAIKIGNVTFDKTTEVYATPEEGAEITGADPSFIESTAEAKFKGVFTSSRNVKLDPFIISKYPVTQELYTAVIKGQTVGNVSLNPEPFDSKETGDTALVKGEVQKYRAADNITWYDAVYFCNALTEKTMSADDKVYTISNIKFAKGGNIDSAVVTADFTKKGYRLPTEAEWEYAARGGDPLKADWNYLFSGAASAENVSYDSTMNAGLDAVGWYSKNLINGKTDETIDLKPDSEGNKIIPVGYGTHEAGKKAPNALGLYDMSGNVYEWCYDWYNDNISAGDIEENGFVNNPVGPSEGVKRVRRGGSYSFNASFASVTYRNNKKPDAPNNMGFRLVRNAE